MSVINSIPEPANVVKNNLKLNLITKERVIGSCSGSNKSNTSSIDLESSSEPGLVETRSLSERGGEGWNSEAFQNKSSETTPAEDFASDPEDTSSKVEDSNASTVAAFEEESDLTEADVVRGGETEEKSDGDICLEDCFEVVERDPLPLKDKETDEEIREETGRLKTSSRVEM